MNYKTPPTLIFLMMLASAATAQIDPDTKGWKFSIAAHGGDDTNLSVYAGDVDAHEVVVEHWVVRDPEEIGFRFGGGELRPSGSRYTTAREFLEDMWEQSTQRNEQWFYARQMVVYKPLQKAAEQRWEYFQQPIACVEIIDERGRVVGRQVRTKRWSLFTDHWVLYPEYAAASQRGAVSFVDVIDGGCDWPADMVQREFRAAEHDRAINDYRYATTTFALVPLQP